jgi:hypothetical protein
VSLERLVSDQITGLTWQRDLSPASLDWQAAKNYCEKMTYAGYCDWRLPSRIELTSLLDHSKTIATATLDIAAFGQDAPRAEFWSASPAAHRADMAWTLSFERGWAFTFLKTRTFRVRCVRGGDEPNGGIRYEVGAGALAGTVLDSATGLRWQREAPVVDAANAASACEAASTGGFDDFRIPSLVELATLIDESCFSTAADLEAFPGHAPGYFLAREMAGPEFSDGAGFWIVDFSRGNLSIIGGGGVNLRCVRNE